MIRRPRTTLSGRSVVITGAASGIGRALAQRLSQHGCAVAIVDIDEKGLTETENSLRGPSLARVFDVAEAAAHVDFANDSDPADDNWLWNINFHGVVNGTRAFLPILVEQNSGAIVNTSSVFGLVGMPNRSAYCAAKFAVRGFTDALRHELRGTGVTAINLLPGGISTNIVRNARFRKDPEGLGPNHEQLITQFAAMALAQPNKAAEVIHRGVEEGKARILIGPDALTSLVGWPRPITTT